MEPASRGNAAQLCGRCVELFEFGRPDLIEHFEQMKKQIIARAINSKQPKHIIEYLQEDLREYQEGKSTDSELSPYPIRSAIGSHIPSPYLYGAHVWRQHRYQRTWGDVKNSAAASDCRLCKTLVALLLYQQRHKPPENGLLDSDPITSSWHLGADDLSIRNIFFQGWKGEKMTHSVAFHASGWPEGVLPYEPKSPRGSMTNDDYSVDFLSQAFHNCLREHKTCGAKHMDFWIPTRLLDLMPPSRSGWVALVDRVDIQRKEETQGSASNLGSKYFTLSHQWGSHIPLCLTTKSFAGMKEGIPDQAIPQCYRDAIYVTRRCGIRYIWIDSLCIIQDSAEDWQVEAATMDRVYSSGSCNIIAYEAKDSTYSIFCERDPSEGEAIIHHQAYRHGSIAFTFEPDWTRTAQLSSRLWSRGWVIQERFLSPRLMHFSRFPTWQCNEGCTSEASPRGYESNKGRAYDIALYQMRQMNPLLIDVAQKRSQEDTILDNWLGTVELYSNCSLTRTDEDKVIAIGGLAKAYRTLLDVEYFAGIWGGDYFMSTLCWMRPMGEKEPQSRTVASYRAPSWSWASVDGVISYAFSKHRQGTRHMAQMISTKIETKTKNVYGQITGGWLKIQGHLFPAHRDIETSDSETSDSESRLVDPGCVLNDNRPVFFFPLASNRLGPLDSRRKILGLYLRSLDGDSATQDERRYERIAAGTVLSDLMTFGDHPEYTLEDDVIAEVVRLEASLDAADAGVTILIV